MVLISLGKWTNWIETLKKLQSEHFAMWLQMIINGTNYPSCRYSQDILTKFNSQSKLILILRSWILQLQIRGHPKTTHVAEVQMDNYPKTWLHHKDEMASMALPSGHAASTSEFWYLTCFTKVISCQGSRPAPKR